MFKDDCIFCKIVKKEIPASIIHEDDKILVFDDIRPQAPVHVVAIVKEHVATLADVSDKDAALVGKLVLGLKNTAREKGVQEAGYRIVINCNKDGGQAVFHLHAHLLGGRNLSWPPG